MNVLSAVASVATLVLFTFYIIGRAWTIVKETQFGTEVFYSCETDAKMEYDDEINFSGNIMVKTVSMMAYKYFRVSRVEINTDNMQVTKRIETRGLDNLRANKPFYVNIDCNGIMPDFIAEFQRADGIKGSFFYVTSGKTGEIEALDYKLMHTMSSVLYYLFR